MFARTLMDYSVNIQQVHHASVIEMETIIKNFNNL